MTFESGFYLILIEDGKIVDHDGSHSSMEGVSKAIYLYRQLGFYKKDRHYKMIEIRSMNSLAKKISQDRLESVLFKNEKIFGFKIAHHKLPEPSNRGINGPLLNLCKMSLRMNSVKIDF